MWNDTKPFRVISNYHGLDLREVKHKERNGRFRDITCPKAIVDYKKFMGGVSTANQLLMTEGRERPKVQEMVAPNFLLSFGEDPSKQLDML